MAGNDSRMADHVRDLNDWHLRLAMAVDVAKHLLTEMDGSEWMHSAAHLVREQLEQLVGSCPFPNGGDAP